jgi:RNA polymerase sigma factor (TIGR02999 family)
MDSMHEEASNSESVPLSGAASADELLPLVYDELRRLAAARLSGLAADQTLQATALVHEAWLRMADPPGAHYANRRHFFNAAAQAMRHLLIERARRKMRQRHGGGMERVGLDEVEIAAPDDGEKLLQIHEALDELALAAPDKAEIVKLRFFAGLEEQEIAELLGLSTRTVERHWAYAKAWLFERIGN